jgi:hypothetical protein
VALATTVLELSGHDVLYDAEILTPGVTEVQIPEYEGKVDEQVCDAARVALIKSSAGTTKIRSMQ